MQVNIIMQKENENTLASAISKCLGENAKKAYFFVGNFKESGYKIIEEDLIDIKTKLFFVIGIDKKTTTRSMLESLLDYTDDVYYYSNNNLNEFVSNICVFEYTDRAYVYVSGSNISESGIQTDLSLYTKITYDLKDSLDKKEYKSQLKELQKVVDEDGFNKLDSDTIEKLVEEKEIFSTRQYNHSVMSISELLGKKSKKEEEKENKEESNAEDVYKNDIEIPKIDLSDMSDDISIDIEIPEEESQRKPKDEIAIEYDEEKITLPKDIETYEETVSKDENDIDKNNELYDESMAGEELELNGDALDINDMLFSKADVKLNLETTKSKKKKSKNTIDEEENVVKVKKVNLNNITNLIFEVSSRNAKEEDAIRIPNHIRTMIPEFFGLDEAETQEINGTAYKVKHISLEVVNAKTDEKYKDDEAMITYKPRQSYLTFVSSVLSNIMYDEDDIVRIIKLSDNEYHMEIISKKMKEYKVWSKLCNQTFRTSTKKFGVM